MNNSGGGGFNRNFSGPQMGGMAGGFQPAMGGFQGGQMGGQMGGQFGGFNRGGMMNGMRGGPGSMRGGRGGMGNGMMGGMPMGGMTMGPMAGMAPPMGMGQMGGGMPGKTNLDSPSSVSLRDMESLSGKWYETNVITGYFSGSPSSSSTSCAGDLSIRELTNFPFAIGSYFFAAEANGCTGGGFQGLQPHFNPAFFQPNHASGGDWQNPHGVKRPRPE